MKVVGIKGFTIVELLIVIVVIAILAAISVVAYNGIQSRATLTQQLSAVQQYVKAFNLHTTDKGFYPYGGTSPTGQVACVYAPAANCDGDGNYNAGLTTSLASNIAPYLGSTPSFNRKVAVNYSTFGSFTGVYFFVLFVGDIDCPQVGGTVFLTKTAGNPTQCRYIPAVTP